MTEIAPVLNLDVGTVKVPPCCLPRNPAGSASMTSLSRPAQALHTLRPVDALDRQKRPLFQGFDLDGYPSKPPDSYRANRPLPGWDFHPRGDRAVRGAPEFHREKASIFWRFALMTDAPVKAPCAQRHLLPLCSSVDSLCNSVSA